MPLLQDVIKRSRQKSELLENLANSLVRAEELEKKLQEKTQQASWLQTKLDGTVAEYHNEIQRLTAEKDKVVDKNKTLRREKQGNLAAAGDSENLFCAQLTYWSLMQSSRTTPNVSRGQLMTGSAPSTRSKRNKKLPPRSVTEP